MNDRMGIAKKGRMVDEFTNIYSSIYLIVITLVGQLISVFKGIREDNSGERGHVCWLG